MTGCGLLFITLCFAIASRYYLRAVLQQNGLVSIDDYPAYLQIMDNEVDMVQETKRLGENELKAVIQAALKDVSHAHSSHHHQHHHKVLKEFGRWLGSVMEDCRGCFRSSGSSIAPADSTYNEDELRAMINASFKQIRASDDASSEKGDAVNASVAPEDKKEAQAVSKTASNMSPKHKLKHNTFKHGHLRQLTDIFFLRNPTIYFEGVQMLLLPLALYFAVWMVEFSVYKEEAYLKVLRVPCEPLVCMHILSTRVVQFVSLFIGFLSVFCVMYVVKSAALLKVRIVLISALFFSPSNRSMVQAMYHVDKDAMLEVIEQTEGSRLLGETIREKLLQRLASVSGDAYSTLRNLFDEIDKNRSNKLSRVEFEILMDRLEVNFSRKKWKQIYHEIDRNYDDEISFDEFFIFLFPNHDYATANEIKRLKIVRSRIVQRQQDLRSSIFGGKASATPQFDNILEKVPDASADVESAPNNEAAA